MTEKAVYNGSKKAIEKTVKSQIDKIASYFESLARKKYLPNPTRVQITIPSGTPQGVEFTSEVLPDEGYIFNIRYFRLITPPEVEATFVLVNQSGESVLIPDYQPENTIEVYDYSDYDNEFFKCEKILLSAKTTTTTTSDRVVTLEFSGNQQLLQ